MGVRKWLAGLLFNTAELLSKESSSPTVGKESCQKSGYNYICGSPDRCEKREMAMISDNKNMTVLTFSGKSNNQLIRFAEARHISIEDLVVKALQTEAKVFEANRNGKHFILVDDDLNVYGELSED